MIGVGDDNFKGAFSEADVDKVLLSGSMAGLEPEVVHEVHTRTNSKLLHAEQLIGGMEATSSFAHGFYAIDKKIVDSVLNRIWQFAGNHTGLQGRGRALAMNQVIGRDAPAEVCSCSTVAFQGGLGQERHLWCCLGPRWRHSELDDHDYFLVV